jgi:hypothetical protein
MPNNVEDVRFMIERVRLKEGVSAPPLLPRAPKWFGLAGSAADAGGDGSFGGVALVIFKSNGRRGVGRSIGGPSEGMFITVVRKCSVNVVTARVCVSADSE